MPNNPNYGWVEALPDCLPVFVKIQAGGLKSPCQFEIVMEGLPALHMLMSSEHRFPTEKNHNFEKEKLFILNNDWKKDEV